MSERFGETQGRHGRSRANVPARRALRTVSFAAFWAAVSTVGCAAQLTRLEGSDTSSGDSMGSPSDHGSLSSSSSAADAGDGTWDAAAAGSGSSATAAATTAVAEDASTPELDAHLTLPGDASVSGGQNSSQDNAAMSDTMAPNSTTKDDAGAGDCGEGVALCIVKTTPSHQATGVSTATHLVLEFNQVVHPGSGTLSVIASSSGSLFERVPLTDSRVKVDGTVVTVDLDGILGSETRYSVTLTGSALTTGEEIPFSGLTLDQWTFTTAETELPVSSDALLLWVDASFESSVKRDAGNVVVVGDRSGSNNSLRQSSPGAQPSLAEVEWAERDVLRFDGNDVLLASELTAPARNYDVFLVWRSPVTPPTTLTTLFSHGVSDGVLVQLTHGHSVAGFRNAAITRLASGAYQALQFSPPAANQTYLWNASFDGARMNLFVDGRAANGVDVSEVPRTPTEVMALGGGPSGNFAFNGFVGELLYYGRALSGSERATLSDHLLQKWNR